MKISLRNLMIFISLIAYSTPILLAEATFNLQIRSEQAAGRINKRDPSYTITVQTILHRQRQKEKLFLVDIRNQEAFKRLRIPGSINIPLHSVKTKAFLKSNPVILVHKGYGYSRLENECKYLRDRGFSIYILIGGLNAWKQNGGRLEGDPFAQKTINKMPPQAFYLEKDFENWLVIDASTVQKEESKRSLPYATHLPVLEDPARLLVKIDTLTRKQKQNPFLSVLVFNESGEGYERIEKIVKKIELKNVFYLEGGIEGYRRFLQHLTDSWKPKESRIKTINKCRTCKEKE